MRATVARNGYAAAPLERVGACERRCASAAQVRVAQCICVVLTVCFAGPNHKVILVGSARLGLLTRT